MTSRIPSSRSGASRPSRRQRPYSESARRPVSRRARDRKRGTASDADQVAREAERYSLREDAKGSEYGRFSHQRDAEAEVAQGEVGRYDARRSRYAEDVRKKRRRKRILMAILIPLAVVLVAGLAVAGGFLSKINGNLSSGIDGNLRALLSGNSAATQPSYFLLLGTDESKARDNNPNYSGAFRADTIILARVDPTTKKVALVSIPRDTKVDLGGDYGVQKINAASTLGGASLSVQAVENLTGVDIDHYAQVNFDGFKDIVDALGGIEVNVPVEINDPKAGGHLDKGKQTLNGKQALILCRSRHTYDNVGSGDLYRAANQRLVLTAIAKKLLSTDPVTMANTVSTMSQYVTTDVSSTDILALAQAFHGFDADKNMYTAQFPTSSSYEDDAWYEVADMNTWQQMKARMDAGESPAESNKTDDATGTVLATTGDSDGSGSSGNGSSSSSATSHSGAVAVRNGTATEGLASTAADSLSGMGFTCTTGNAESSDYTSTVVVYDDSADASEAQAIVKKLGCGSAVQNDGSYSFTGKFLVVLGTDYAG